MDSKLYYLDRDIKDGVSDTLVTKTHTLLWTFPDFMWLLDNQTNREISTTREETNKGTGTYAGDSKNTVSENNVFNVKLEFVGRENDLIEIYFMVYDTIKVQASCSVRYYDDDGSFSFTPLAWAEKYSRVHKNIWHLLTVQYKRELEEENKLKNNEFVLKFEMDVYVRKNTSSEQTNVRCQKFVPTMPEIKLVDDLSSLLMSAAFSDVTVRSVEGEEFPAHQALLGARSSVLRAHFEHDTAENRTRIVESPFEAVVLKKLLAYIYTDAVPNIDQFPRKLLEAANYYEMNRLKSLCEPVIAKELSAENAIETLEFANKYKTVYLKRTTLQFIKDGAAADITETDGWKASASADVIKSVYECVVRNKIK